MSRKQLTLTSNCIFIPFLSPKTIKRQGQTNLSISVLSVRHRPQGQAVETVRVLLCTVTVEKGEVYYRLEVEPTTLVLKVPPLDKNPIYLLWLI